MKRSTMEAIDSALEGTLSKEAFDDLQEDLRHDPSALDHYCAQAAIHGRLEWELGAAPNVSEIPTCFRRSSPTVRRKLLYVAAAAALVMLGFFAGTSISSGPFSSRTTQASMRPQQSVARLIQQTKNARWANKDLQIGGWLSSGPMTLVEGSAQIAFDSGASVRLHAPATVYLASPIRARLDVGKAIVDIPEQASGFVMESPTAEFMHRGSRFGIAVEADGHTELHVIRGEVELNPKRGSRESLRLAKDNITRVGQDGILEEQARYVVADFGEVAAPDAALMPENYLHWSFDAISPPDSLFPETGLRPQSTPPYPASTVKLEHDASAALISGPFGSAVKLDGATVLSTRFPGYSGSSARTIAFWLLIPPDTPDQYSYSILSWGAPAPHQGGKWQVAWNVGKDNAGRKGAIRTEVQNGFSIGSTDLRDGKWHHVAIVFPGGKGASTRDIRYYIDGKLDPVTAVWDKEVKTITDAPESFPLSLGYRVDDDNRKQFRSFRGSIDELYLFSCALLPSQIESLFLRNTPPRRIDSNPN